jgi:WD40 repeat protein
MSSWLTEAWLVHAGDYPTAFAAAPNGLRVAVSTAAGELFLVDARSGNVVARERAYPDGQACAAWRPDGSLLATAQGGLITLRHANGAATATVAGPWSAIDHLLFLGDPERLAVVSGSTLWISDRDGTIALEVTVPDGPINTVALSSRGDQLALAHAEAITLLSLERGLLKKVLPCAGGPISLAWSPSDTMLASGTADHRVRLHHLAGGRDSEIVGFTSQARRLSWMANGQRLAVTGAAPVSIWSFEGNAPTAARPLWLRGHQALCTTVAFHPSRALLATGGDDKRVLVWPPIADTTPRGLGIMEDTVIALAWVLGGDLLLGADTLGTIRAWQLDTA